MRRQIDCGVSTTPDRIQDEGRALTCNYGNFLVDRYNGIMNDAKSKRHTVDASRIAIGSAKGIEPSITQVVATATIVTNRSADGLNRPNCEE